MAELIRGLDAARVRENAERIRSEIGTAELLAAVKYVALEELEVLAEAGVEDVHDLGICTICRNDLFFSHRADKGTTGRQAGVVWRV